MYRDHGSIPPVKTVSDFEEALMAFESFKVFSLVSRA